MLFQFKLSLCRFDFGGSIYTFFFWCGWLRMLLVVVSVDGHWSVLYLVIKGWLWFNILCFFHLKKSSTAFSLESCLWESTDELVSYVRALLTHNTVDLNSTTGTCLWRLFWFRVLHEKHLIETCRSDGVNIFLGFHPSVHMLIGTAHLCFLADKK